MILDRNLRIALGPWGRAVLAVVLVVADADDSFPSPAPPDDDLPNDALSRDALGVPILVVGVDLSCMTTTTHRHPIRQPHLVLWLHRAARCPKRLGVGGPTMVNMARG